MPPMSERIEPVSKAKTAEDLKLILKGMTAASGKEKQQKQTEKQSSLKDALANIIAKQAAQPTTPSAPPAAQTPASVVESPQPAIQPATQPATAAPKPEEKKPAEALARETKQNGPFEVPEDTLRKVLKGDV